MKNTTQKDPTTMEVETTSHFSPGVEEPDTIADPEGVEIRNEALENNPQLLPIWVDRDYTWKRIRKEQYPNVADCVKAGKRAFMLVVKPEHTQACLDAIPGVYESLGTVKGLDQAKIVKAASMLTEAGQQVRSLLGEKHADDIVLAMASATQRTVAYLTDRLVGLEKYSALPNCKQENIEKQLGDLASTQEEAAILKLLVSQLQTAAGQNASNKVNLKGAVYDRMRANANRNGSQYFHPEELATRKGANTAMSTSVNGVILGSMMGKKAA